jgi:RNA polymerase sigma-70 factor (ECF subfamily)
MAKKSSIQEMAKGWIETKSESKFTEIVKRLTPGMHKHICEIERNPIKRVEILNDAFSKVWTQVHQYNEDRGAFSTWVYGIVRNEALLSKRHSNKTSSLDEMSEYGVNNYKNSIEYSTEQTHNFDNKVADSVIDDLYAVAVDAINNFPSEGKFKNWKQALILKEIEGKQFNQIAELMNENENTVKGWVCKARRYLGKLLEDSQTNLVNDYKKLKNINEN